MASIKELLGTQNQLYDNLIQKASFDIRCCIPGIIQSYNANNNTAEIQPAIREEVVNEDNSVSYVNLPLLINVPIVFPSTKLGGVRFTLEQGDECLVVFSDLSYDNFWTSGNVQNPIEVRRHDLSDGIAIPCVLSQPNTKAVESGLTVSFGEAKINMNNDNIILSDENGQITLEQIIRLLRHKHKDSLGGSTGLPEY